MKVLLVTPTCQRGLVATGGGRRREVRREAMSRRRERGVSENWSMADECLTSATTELQHSEPSRSLVAVEADVIAAADVVTVSDDASTFAYVNMPPVNGVHIPDAQDIDDDTDNDDQQLPYPEYVEKAFFYFLQTTPPRNWCLQLITWIYPLRMRRLYPYVCCVILKHFDHCMLRHVFTNFDRFRFLMLKVNYITYTSNT